ncbi:MAG: methyltransferase domain-containing protein [Anaerolineae bacterium]
MTIKSVGRTVLGEINRPTAGYRLRRYLRAHPPPYRLQVGSGTVERAGWLNTDIGPRARYWLDIGRPFPFPDASVSRVFSEHVVEHVTPTIVARFLGETRRVLMPDGILRILTPDAEATARAYADKSPAAYDLMRRAARLGYDSRHLVDILNLTFHANGHVYIWDEASLTAALTDAGFSRIERKCVGESADPEMAAMDGHFAPGDPAIPFTLVLEAQP